MNYKFLPYPPTTKTPGNEGDYYIDTDSGVIYICKGCNTVEEIKDFVTMTLYPTPDFAEYVWEKQGGNDNMFVIKYDVANGTIDTSVEDILNAKKSGKCVCIVNPDFGRTYTPVVMTSDDISFTTNVDEWGYFYGLRINPDDGSVYTFVKEVEVNTPMGPS